MSAPDFRTQLRERKDDFLTSPILLPALSFLGLWASCRNGMAAALRFMHRAESLLRRIPLYRRYEEYFNYMIFGTLTAAIQFAVYYFLLYAFSLHYVLADNVGFAVSVLFAYETNRRYVYKSTAVGTWDRIYQFIMFVGSRLVGQLLETVLLIVFVEWLEVGEATAKFPVLVLVILINYLSGKLLVFTKAQAKGERQRAGLKDGAPEDALPAAEAQPDGDPTAAEPEKVRPAAEPEKVLTRR